MTIELTGEQATVLRAVLDQYLADLRMEIARTSDPRYRDLLRHRRECLEDVLRELGEDVIPVAYSAPPHPDPM